jgi:hypothetical protein
MLPLLLLLLLLLLLPQPEQRIAAGCAADAVGAYLRHFLPRPAQGGAGEAASTGGSFRQPTRTSTQSGSPAAGWLLRAALKLAIAFDRVRTIVAGMAAHRQWYEQG